MSLSTKKAAKKLIKVAKEHPEWYTEQEVWYANKLNIMKKRNLKKIVKDLKVLLEELESEVYSDPSAYVHPWYEQTEGPRVGVSEDDDGYPE